MMRWLRECVRLRDLAMGLLVVAALFGCVRVEPPAGAATDVASTATAVSQSTRTPTPTVPADLAARAAALGRGVNLGNALEAPREGEWGMVIEPHFFPLIREAGFDTIRVPIRWSAHAEAAPPYTVDTAFFERVDWVIDQGLANDLNVVINMHHYDPLFEDPEAHYDRFVAIWTQIAIRYADRPDTLYFEPLNEPHGNLDATRWNTLLARTIAAIRAVDDHHTLVVGGADWGSINGLTYLSIPEGETNVIGTFHLYDPMLFTHQGAEWVGPEYGTLGVTWPGPPEEEVAPIPEARAVDWVRTWFARYNQTSGSANPASREAIGAALDRALAWSERRGVPLWLGEFGAYQTADMDSRVRWTETVRAEAEARGFTWAYWEFGAGFGIYDRESEAWRTPLLEALIPAP
jgi:endoglucanase